MHIIPMRKLPCHGFILGQELSQHSIVFSAATHQLRDLGLRVLAGVFGVRLQFIDRRVFDLFASQRAGKELAFVGHVDLLAVELTARALPSREGKEVGYIRLLAEIRRLLPFVILVLYDR